MWDNKKVKINQSTLCNDCKDGGLKNVDIEHENITLKFSWVKRLYTENFCEWKIGCLQYINKFFGKIFKLYSNLNITKNTYTIFVVFTKIY